MKMGKCDTCRANKVCDHNWYGFENCGNYIPADTVTNVISDIKKIIHSNATYPIYGGAIGNYITLKAVDALLQDYLNKYTK